MGGQEVNELSAIKRYRFYGGGYKGDWTDNIKEAIKSAVNIGLFGPTGRKKRHLVTKINGLDNYELDLMWRSLETAGWMIESKYISGPELHAQIIRDTWRKHRPDLYVFHYSNYRSFTILPEEEWLNVEAALYEAKGEPNEDVGIHQITYTATRDDRSDTWSITGCYRGVTLDVDRYARIAKGSLEWLTWE